MRWPKLTLKLGKKITLRRPPMAGSILTMSAMPTISRMINLAIA